LNIDGLSKPPPAAATMAILFGSFKTEKREIIIICSYVFFVFFENVISIQALNI